ncbi:MAG TPA: nitrile hydratase subunit alpha [Burkholderiales bacterium]|jgi:nitrile hydratase|nr:nitrile hydratase subunit alpha [Burkholderiales bacterium]
MNEPHDRHDHDHAHGAGHRHPPQADHDDALTYYRRLEIAVRELLIQKGIITAAEVSKVIEDIESRSPEGGARVVARAWDDTKFRELLLRDATTALTSMGFELALFLDTQLVVVENTPDVHNVVVCTLCSCYPRMLLGLPPAWYKSRAYRARVVSEPRAVLREFGLEISDRVAVRVHDSTADLRYLVLPMRPLRTERMNQAELTALVTRDSMIGTAVCRAPE